MKHSETLINVTIYSSKSAFNVKIDEYFWKVCEEHESIDEKLIRAHTHVLLN